MALYYLSNIGTCYLQLFVEQGKFEPNNNLGLGSGLEPKWKPNVEDDVEATPKSQRWASDAVVSMDLIF